MGETEPSCPTGIVDCHTRLGQDAREWESEGKESEAMRRAPAAAGGCGSGEGGWGKMERMATDMWAPQPRGRHVSETAGQNHPMAKVGRF